MSLWNTANVARVGPAYLACLAGFALVILSTSLADAEYGPRTIIGANYQQWSNTKSTEDCFDTISCSILFQRTPQNRALIIQHVSCFMIVSTTGFIVGGRLGTLNGPSTRTNLVPVQTTTGLPQNQNRWIVNAPVMHLVESGKRPVMTFQTTTSVTDWNLLECSISGRLANP